MAASQTDYRDQAQTAMSAANAAQSAVAAAQIAWIADVVIAYSSAVSLSLAPRTASFAIAGSKIDDRVYVHRHGRPTLAGANVTSGIIIEGTGYVSADGAVEVYHVIPAVGVGQTLSIPLRLVGYRGVAAT